MKDGIYTNLSNEDYHSELALSASGVKQLLSDPLEYWYNSPLNKGECETKSTDAMRFGSLVHALLLEPDTFDDTYFIVEKGKKCPPDKEKVTALMLERAEKMVNELQGTSQLSQLFKFGIPEISFFWTDKKTGLPMRCRPDHIQIGGSQDKRVSRIVDYKTVSSVSEHKIRSNILDFGYDIQAKHYLNGVRAIKKLYKAGKIDLHSLLLPAKGLMILTAFLEAPKEEFVFCFQTKKPPYVAAGHDLDGYTLENAEEHIENAIQIYQHCHNKYGESRWYDGDKISTIYIEEYGNKYDWIHMERLNARKEKPTEEQIEINYKMQQPIGDKNEYSTN